METSHPWANSIFVGVMVGTLLAVTTGENSWQVTVVIAVVVSVACILFHRGLLAVVSRARNVQPAEPDSAEAATSRPAGAGDPPSELRVG
jgi:hypothetical protein